MTFKELVMGRLQTCGSLKVPQVTAKALEEVPQEVAEVSKVLEAKNTTGCAGEAKGSAM